jgi:hypothetical protein
MIKAKPNNNMRRNNKTQNYGSNRNNKTGENMRKVRDVTSKINQSKQLTSQPKLPLPMTSFLRTLLHRSQPITPTPFEQLKRHYKRVLYQDTLTVNASGHCAIILAPSLLAQFSSISEGSPVLYANQASYDPTSTGNTVSGGWNTSIISGNGINSGSDAFKRAYTQSMHLNISVTGVSNLNKQGQIHIFEDQSARTFYAPISDTTFNNIYLNQYPIQDLPKALHYKRVDIMNMDSNTNIEYHYIPYSLYNNKLDYSVTGYNSGTVEDSNQKVIGVIANNCAVGTTLRLEYEINIAYTVDNNFINSFPPVYSSIAINPDPYTQILTQDISKVITTHNHENKIVSNRLGSALARPSNSLRISGGDILQMHKMMG